MDYSFILKGNICYSESPTELRIHENAYLICKEGILQGVYKQVPQEYGDLPVEECGENLIIPGMSDLHVHAPQYTFRSIGMDLELLEWLNTHTFPEEAKYKDLDYANKAYDIFVEDLKKSPTTRAALFATLHLPATELLMDKLEASGIRTLVGKVNMDRNSPEYLCEDSWEKSLEDTRTWLENIRGKYKNTAPILTPRFIPTCSDELMEGLGEIQREYHLPMQSHLSENFSEIEWVQQLCPWSKFYGDAYDRFGLFGRETPTIMAHCVHSTEEEIARMKDNEVFVAHCPQSNANLASGIAPVRKYIEEGLLVGLGTDVAGGANLSMIRCITDAITMSKLRWRLVDQSLKPLTVEEGFYLATAGGGAFFGKVGTFQKGYEADILVMSDEGIPHPQELTVVQRLERLLYLWEEGGEIVSKYVAGEKIL